MADVSVEAAVAVEITLRVTAPHDDATRHASDRALAIVRESWEAVSLAFARALRDSFDDQGDALRGMTVIASLADGAPQLLLHHRGDEVDDAGA